tara:strand:- start:4998 stop:5561 length:564 start_codon:yes stop_codon:yes gene_type:complete
LKRSVFRIALSGLLGLCLCASALAQSGEIQAHWQITEGEGSRWPKAVNFNHVKENGTLTALILTCLVDDPAILIQDGLIDDDDLTWKQRGTDEDVTLSVSFDSQPFQPIRGFLDGLDASKVFIYPEDEPQFIRDLIASDHVSFDIAPATFDRPDQPIMAEFNMTDAAEEIGGTLAQCGLSPDQTPKD